MSKREFIARYSLIINKLRKGPSNFSEIKNYLKLESELQSYNFDISQRTFQRDLKEIRSIYNIDILYNRSTKQYYIDYDEKEDFKERILEAFDTFNALNISDRLSEYIHFEKRKPQGTENLYGLLHAIKNQLQIKFTYHKFWEDSESIRQVDPYALKEFRNRWYVLAKDQKDEKIKTFALDRLSDLTFTNKKYNLPEGFSVKKYFKHCFGVINSNDSNPDEVILSFTSFQGKYIKTLPLHESQQILEDTENQLKIKLKLYITHDFIMELLSYGPNLKILQPQWLADEVKLNLKKTLELYK